MPQYLAPGVFIEEVPGAKPIEGVGTATAGFLGLTEKGPIGEAQLITNWTQFAETFGGFIPQAYLAYAVNQFFAEGGTRCYVVRTCKYNSPNIEGKPTAVAGQIKIIKRGTSDKLLQIDALSEGSWSDNLWVEISDYDELKDPAQTKFRLSVWYKGVEVEPYEDLTMNEVEVKINSISKYIKAKNLGEPDISTANRPTVSLLVIYARSATTPAEEMGITALDKGLTIHITDQGSQPNDPFTLIIKQEGAVVETFPNLTMDDVQRKVDEVSKYIKVKTYGIAATDKRPLPWQIDLKDRYVPTGVSDVNTPQPTLRVTALVPDLKVEIGNGGATGTDTTKFKLTVRSAIDNTELESKNDLTIENAETEINGHLTRIEVKKLANERANPVNLPTVTTEPIGITFYEPPLFALTNGWDGLGGVTLQDRATQDTLVVSTLTSNVNIEIKNEPTDDSNMFMMTVKAGTIQEIYEKLTMANVEREINKKSQLIEVNIVAANQTTAPNNRPAEQNVTIPNPGLLDSDFTGNQAILSGLYAFDKADDVNIIAIPDRPGDREVTLGGLTYCQNRKDCFFVADPPLGLSAQSVLDYKRGTGDLYAGNAFNSSYGALYYPWIAMSDPLTGKARFVPPSGAVAGTYSSTDVARGVHKAPAGTIDGYLNSAVGIERIVTKGEQESLNPNQVNVIRSFPGAGIVVWGARTVSADPEFRYINVRRLLLYIEKSIEKSTQWVVFEPNDRGLWASLKRDLTAFLNIVWKSGALFGASPEEAFFVKIDDENNPPEMRDAGRLNIDIGVAPVKPAEFVVFRISQKTAGAK